MQKEYTEIILWVTALLADHIYKTIKKTASDQNVVDDYDSEGV
jgi:hypothetical protein